MLNKLFRPKKPLKVSRPKKIALALLLLLLVYLSDLYLQFMQNNMSLDLALKFALSWHTEKFLLGTLVLIFLAVFLIAVLGSYWSGLSLYLAGVFILGVATYLKMSYRSEPIYPDDLKMVTELGLLKEMAGLPLFLLAVVLIVAVTLFCLWRLGKSFFLPKKFQIGRAVALVVSLVGLLYAGQFNQKGNILKAAYDKTALWIPYSQKMNYYNVGFVGGFLFNLNVKAMDEPADYSKKTMEKIVTTYQDEADLYNATITTTEQPNIVYVMSESFSDATRLSGLTIKNDPLTPYKEIANTTYSGQMLSPGYGGGTANIEIEALTGFAMSLFNPQLTTPYTQLMSNFKTFPSLVSLLKNQGYDATAIHPYNTSMYKREEVYKVLGFDDFFSESSMDFTDKLDNNPYISDASAYKQVMQALDKNDTPQFVHLVTMQTHMPYAGKYSTLDYEPTPADDTIANYLQDVHEASMALSDFLAELENSGERTLVVFWGDHLPSIYSDAIKKANTDAQLHLTEFLMFDSTGKLVDSDNHSVTTSPFYYASNLMQQAQLKESGFYAFLQKLQEKMPAFESNSYYTGTDFKSEYPFSDASQKLYDTYKLLQYDQVSGKAYANGLKFYDVEN